MTTFQKKKVLGQHFLKDPRISSLIASELPPLNDATVLEIGAGLGALSEKLLQLEEIDLRAVETDKEAVEELQKSLPEVKDRIIQADFLQLDLNPYPELIITGNFPYSISSPLLVRVAEERDRVRKLVGMFQKEFADRIRAEPGSKAYGRISVLVQTFYDADKCFHVEPGSFSPPPKVRSSVVKLIRNERNTLPCDQAFYFRIVKQAFGQRRKTLRNALKDLLNDEARKRPFFGKRAEELSIEEFIGLAIYLEGRGELPES